MSGAGGFIESTMESDPNPSRRHGLALCLSGGGYRAALFHLGALRRLDELGILGRLDTVSGVSGGSIVANLLADPRLEFPAAGATDPAVGGFEDFVAEPLRRLTARNIRTPALLAKLKPLSWVRPDATVRALADQFADAIAWWRTPLRESHGNGPAVVTGATDVTYGVDWVFEDSRARPPHGRVGDYRIGYAVPPRSVRIADAVAASCAFPPFFAPMVFDGDALGLTGGHRGLESEQERLALRRRVRLTDGGVYDNLGLEPVWKTHRTVLVSDGGGVFRARTEHTAIGRTLRILGIASAGGESVRNRWLHAGFARGVLTGVTWALDTDIRDAADPGYPPATAELINAVRTDLDVFSEQEQHVLERHGYQVADAQIRVHAPALVERDSPPRPPHPDVADPGVAQRALRDSAKRRLVGRT